MKIALCIHGQPRFYGETELGQGNQSLLNFIVDRYDTDVFFHTRWSKEEVGKTYPHAPWLQYPSDDDMRIQPNTVERLIDMYKPKAHEVSPVHNIKPYIKRGADSNDGAYEETVVLALFYMIYRAKELKNKYKKETGVSYDWVIKARFDSFLTKFDLEDMVEDRLNVPNDCHNLEIFNDQFSVAREVISDKSTDTYLNIEKYIKDPGPFWKLDSPQIGAESLLARQCMETGVEPHRNSNIGHTLLRQWDASYGKRLSRPHDPVTNDFTGENNIGAGGYKPFRRDSVERPFEDDGKGDRQREGEEFLT